MLPFEKIKRELLVRKKAKTDPKFGCLPEDRKASDIINYGVVNIDKPRGPTSHQVSAYVQKILGISKAGHSGTLDPKVTGVLPIALGRGTRAAQALLIAGKEYICLMHLHKPVDGARLGQVLERFRGKIMQKPPVKSAVKRELRERDIYYLDVIEIKEQDVLFRVGTQAGTYIRKLVHDIGKELGTGAHMAELRRSKAGPFDESTLFTLQDLTDAFHYLREGDDLYIKHVIQPIEKAVSHLPKIFVLDSTVDSLCHGANLNVPGIAQLDSGIEEGDMVAVMTLKDELVALGDAQASSRQMMADKGRAVNVKKVFMLPGIYPKMMR
ncbi:RNA-guided pseudouridylation complex pseudouridine synthase subunit Cbf5 [Candidatus Woesearchaeota archaeon]|nr:RNA-guided pseudouridylation complex pseudouridine synthase subunit Cbf5 [Candidatus Woesearchaeota archaeon]